MFRLPIATSIRSLVLTLLLALPLLGLASSARAEADAQAVIRQFTERLTDVQKQAVALGYTGRLEKMRTAITAAYDMNTMARSALGPSATKLTPEQLLQLAARFSEFTIATYADQFDGYDGERMDVDPPRPSLNNDVVVPSRIVPRTGAPTEINYLMRQDQGRWRIVDVLFEGTISQVAVRRSEFVSVFRRDGFSGLIEMLDQRTAAMGKH